MKIKKINLTEIIMNNGKENLIINTSLKYNKIKTVD